MLVFITMNTSKNRRSGRLQPTGPFRPSDWFDTSWRWRLLLGAAGLPAGIVYGFSIAAELFRGEAVSAGFLPGIYFGAPIGALSGIVVGVLLGRWVDRWRTRFNLRESLAMLFIVAALVLLFVRYVYPMLLRF